MSYKDRALAIEQEALRKLVAQKLLDGIDKIVLDATEFSSRRWVWELLQNAKDVADKKVKIEIELGDNFVEFRHNGNPFEMEHLTYLIKQISTKDRQNENSEIKATTGQFGTGFMTTHLLSKIVDVEGVVYNKENEKESYKRFQLRLDRSTDGDYKNIKPIEKMKQNVDLAFEVFDRLDNETISPDIQNYEVNKDYDTKFKYILDAEGLKIANKGVEDLYYSLPYTLIFIPKIEEVKIIQNDKESIFKNENSQQFEDITISTIKVDKTIYYIAHISDESVTVAIQLNYFKEKYYIEKPNIKVPALFCDFPLIGSENFIFPLIINSPFFFPTEPRDGIYLSDKNDYKITKNKRLIEIAKNLYFKVLDYASRNWGDTLWLAKTHVPESIDRDWFIEKIQTPMREIILKTAIVENTNSELIFIKQRTEEDSQAFFPYSDDKEIRKNIWDFFKDIYPQNTPKLEHLHYWPEIIWDDCDKQTIEKTIKDIANYNNLNKLSERIKKNITDTIVWLNSFIQFVAENQSDLLNTIAILPNQYGDFKIKEELYNDHRIPQELKNILLKLGKDWKNKLLDNEIKFKVGKALDVNDISNEIDKIIEKDENYRITENTYKILKEKSYDDKLIEKLKSIEGLLFISKERFEEKLDEIIGKSDSDRYKHQIITNSKDSEMREAIYELISLFPEDFEPEQLRFEIWQFAKDLNKNIPNKKNIIGLIPALWNKADNWLIKILINDIAELKNIETELTDIKKLKEKLDTSEDEILWLNSFFAFFVKNEFVDEYNINTKVITPNQKGEFKRKTDLYFDNSIPEEFKNALEKFEIDYKTKEEKGWRDKLLEPKITAFNTEKTKLKSLGVKNISDEINLIVKDKDHNQSESFLEAIFLISSCFTEKDEVERIKLWQFTKDVFGKQIPDKILIAENITDFDWSSCNNWLLKYLIIKVGSFENTDNLLVHLINKNIFDWLNEFINYIFTNDKKLLNFEGYPILPNYYGDFKFENSLYINDDSIDNDLISILEPFNKEWIENLLHREINLEIDSIRTEDDIVQEIDNEFKDYFFSNKDRQDPNFIKPFRHILKFFNQKDNEYIERNFNWIFKNKSELSVSLLGSENEKDDIFEIIESGKGKYFAKIAKGSLTEDDLEQLAENPEDFKRWKQERKERKSNKTKQQEFEEQLQEEFGMTKDEIYESLKEKKQRTSRSISPDMVAIRESNIRAKIMVRKKLDEDTRYNCTDWRETKDSKTIIYGIKKNDKDIIIVVKGAESGRLYFDTDGKEKEALHKENSELWINTKDTDGSYKQLQMMIGDVLEKVEENKIQYVKTIEVRATDLI